MAEIKSQETLLAELRTLLRILYRSLDTSDNSLVRDLTLYPYSVGGKAIMDQVAIARDLAILSRLSGTDLDSEATNYRLERLTGSYSSISVTFFTETAPVNEIVIPANTQVRTAGTSFVSPVSFSTISETRIPASNVDSYFSFDRGRYEFSATALCNDIGTVGKIAANLITQLTGSIDGIEGVTNLTGASGGTDGESDDDLRARILAAKLGRDLNTVNGLRLFLRSLAFIDAYPVRIEDDEAERATGIDAWVINNSSATHTEVFSYDPSQELYRFTRRPVLEVTSVVGSNAGTLGSNDYDANIDNTSPMRRSVYANDYLNIRAGASLLNGEQITVTYNYASAIVQAQSTLNLVDNEVLTADPLIKRAIQQFFYVNATLTLKANADGPSTRNRVRSALSQYIAMYRLGEDIQESDLIIVLQEGYGDYPIESVDAVVINSYHVLDINGNQRNPVNSVIPINNNEHVLYGQATLT